MRTLVVVGKGAELKIDLEAMGQTRPDLAGSMLRAAEGNFQVLDEYVSAMSLSGKDDPLYNVLVQALANLKQSHQDALNLLTPEVA